MRSKWEPGRFRIFFSRQFGLLCQRVTGPAIQELDHLGNNLRKVAGLAFLFVLVRLETSFDINQAALFQVFLANLAEPVPGFHVDPLRRLLCLAVPALPAVADGYAKMSYLLARGGELLSGSLPKRPIS